MDRIRLKNNDFDKGGRKTILSFTAFIKAYVLA